MGITGLGHVGVYCHDMQKMRSFYHDILGLRINDEAENIIFMSAQDRMTEHHEFVLAKGREDGKLIQQISFRCAALSDLREYYKAFVANDVHINRQVSHGNAIGLYFADPEGNNIEVYWQTGNDWPQPFGEPVDLGKMTDEEIINAHLKQKVSAN